MPFVKDFDGWNVQKKDLNAEEKKIFFREGEIWWASIGMNIGEEVYGKGDFFRRPIFILKKLTSSSFIGIPLSEKEKQGSWYFSFSHKEKKRVLLMNQLRMLSSNRLESRIGKVSDEEFLLIKKALQDFLFSSKG